MEDEGAMTRPPQPEDILILAREFNRLGVKYAVVGGVAMQRLGFVRGTEGIDILLLREELNERLAVKGMTILPEQAILELGDERIADWVVVRVNDIITVDLMTEASGLTYADIENQIEVHRIDGVDIPFAGPAAMLRMKQSLREKDQLDRQYLEKLLRTDSKRTDG
jgi:hypothetical protein